MDMIRIDNLGPISPESNSGGYRYILIVVDYFTRYSWVQALLAINGPAVIDLVANIAKTFGLPRSVYTNNATYLVNGAFSKFLTSRGVRQFSAPKTHPLSVGLLEWYIQLVLYGIWRIVVGGENIQGWSVYLDQVVHSMNTREVRVHGYSPAELLFGYNPVIHHHNFTVRDRQVAHDLHKRQQIWEDSDNDRNVQLDNHLVTRDEALELTRQRYLSRFVVQRGKEGRFPIPKEVNLVLLRRAAIDNRYDKKLEAHWEGPFRLSNLAHHGRSRHLYDLTTGKLVKIKQAGLKDRIHLDDLRVYVSRERTGAEGAEVGSLCDRLDWKGEGAEEWKEIGKGEAVELGKLTEMELGIFQIG